MSNGVVAGIVEWNLARNNLKFDPALEAKMLSEEAREFFTALNLVERCREAADFTFVMVGTLSKYYAQQRQDASEICFSHAHFLEFRRWMEDTNAIIRATLENEFEALGFGAKDVNYVQDVCLRYVLEANRAKNAEKNAEGKVQKGANYVSPSEKIDAFLCGLMEERKEPDACDSGETD